MERAPQVPAKRSCGGEAVRGGTPEFPQSPRLPGSQSGFGVCQRPLSSRRGSSRFGPAMSVEYADGKAPSARALSEGVPAPSGAHIRPDAPASERGFRFFDTTVLVRSDVPELLALLDGMFAEFAIAGNPNAAEASGGADLVCSALRGEHGAVKLSVDGREYRVKDRPAALDQTIPIDETD